MNGDRSYFFFENRNGTVPKELLRLCFGLDGLFQNYPKGRNIKKSSLTTRERKQIHKSCKLLLRLSVSELAGTKKLAIKNDDIFLMKFKTQNNPRLYFTNRFPDRFVLLHGLKKKDFEEDPKDLAKAEQRLLQMLCDGD